MLSKDAKATNELSKDAKAKRHRRRILAAAAVAGVVTASMITGAGAAAAYADWCIDECIVWVDGADPRDGGVQTQGVRWQ